MFKNKKGLAVLIVFVFFLLWWVCANFFSMDAENLRNDFTDTYGALAAFSAVVGFLVAGKWGLFKSYVGKALSFFSVSLLSQFLGNLSYTLIYRFTGVENAYPSFGEIFYFLSVPLYIMAVYYLSKASGLGFSLKRIEAKVISVLVPVLLVSVSYYYFLSDYDFTDMPLINIFLDFFYPLGQATFVAFALVVFFVTKRILGGVMKGKVIFILFALIFQYIADSMFLYETINDLWIPAGTSDLMFLISYFLMGIGLCMFDDILPKKREEVSTSI